MEYICSLHLSPHLVDHFPQFRPKDLSTREGVDVEWNSIGHEAEQEQEIVEEILHGVLQVRLVLLEGHRAVDALNDKGNGKERVEKDLNEQHHQ